MKTRKTLPSSSIAGFTLIEMLVVVIIIGVLGSIAAPSWLSYLNRQRVTTVRDELKAVLKEAQTKAQQKSTSYSVVLGSTPDGPTAALSTAGAIANPVTLGSNTKNIQLASFVGSTASSASLEFNYRGEVSKDDLPFVIKVISDNSSDTQKCLIVSSLLGGIVEAEKSTCDNPNLGT